MNIMQLQLANSIQSVVHKHYVPFQGVNEEAVINHVNKYFNASRYDILVAIEYVLNKG
jgi:hypothetical protein